MHWRFSDRLEQWPSKFSYKSAANVCWHVINDSLLFSRDNNMDGSEELLYPQIQRKSSFLKESC